MDTRYAVIACAGLTGVAQAGYDFTTINPAMPEQGHGAILSDMFGGVFVADGAVDFTNGAAVAHRLGDGGAPGIVDLLTGDSHGADDRIWGDGAGIQLALEAKFAGDQAVFGWMDGTSGGSFVPLIDTDNIGDTVMVSLSPEFRWALNDESFGNLVTSNPADQSLFDSAVDHMVAYHMTGVGGGNTFVIFFEDRIGGDYDFNDAVIQISTVPAPGALALVGLGGVLIACRRRR